MKILGPFQSWLVYLKMCKTKKDSYLPWPTHTKYINSNKKKTYRGLRCVPSQAPADAVVDVDVDVAANTF